MMRRTGSVRGFTLLELLVVLALTGLIASLAPPLISSVMPGVRMRAQVEEIATALREGRVEALRLGSVAEVVFSLDDSGYVGVDGATYRLAEGMHLAASGPSGLDSAAPRSAAFTVRFYPDGSSSGGEIDLTGAGAHYRVVVDWLMGRVEVGRLDG